MRWLTPEEIADRLQRFNETSPYDWSIFDDVPEEQHVDIMYPFILGPVKRLALLSIARASGKEHLNQLFGKFGEPHA